MVEKALETAFLFEEVNEPTRKAIAAIAVEISQPKGTHLFRAGDFAGYLFILQTGRVRLALLGGGRLAHMISSPGDALGWSSMAGNGAYTASAECMTPVRALRFESSELERILARHPASGMAFYRRLSEMIGRRLVESYSATLSLHTQSDPRCYG